ncbi:MAG: hypothetical protein ACJA06_002286 [Halocynthiibacter sp.]|jgi:hypothetical protein
MQLPGYGIEMCGFGAGLKSHFRICSGGERTARNGAETALLGGEICAEIG